MTDKPKLPEKEISYCCEAPVIVMHGCDSDTGHGGKPCDCEVSTCYWVCSRCDKPCDLYHEPKTKLPEKIDTSFIRGRWTNYTPPYHSDDKGSITIEPTFGGGDDTEKSIKLVAEKVNAILDYLKEQENKYSS